MDQENLSVQPSQEPDGVLKIPEDSSSSVSPMGADDLATRTTQYDVAFGSDTPGTDKISTMLQSNQEPQLRDQLHLNETNKRLKATNQVVADAASSGVAQTDPGLMPHLATPQPAPLYSILEQNYVKNANDMMNSRVKSPDQDQVKADQPVSSMKYTDFAEDAAMKRTIVQSLTRQSDSDVKNQGWLSYGWDETKQLAYFPSWSNLSASVGQKIGESTDSKFWTGNVMAEKVKDLYALPPEEFARQTQAIYQQLKQFSVLDASTFAHALQSYTPLDQLAENSNVAAVLPVGSAFKVVLKGGRILGGVAKGAVKDIIQSATKEEALAAAKGIPIDSNTVRFYHGADKGEKLPLTGSRWLTPDLNYAANFRAGDTLKDVYYIDIPKGHPLEIAARQWDKLDEQSKTNAVGRYGHIELPESMTNQLKPYSNNLVVNDIATAAGQVNAAISDKHVPVEEVLAAGGDTTGAARVQAHEALAANLLPDTAEAFQKQFATLLRKVPSLYSTDAWTVGARKLTGAAADQMVQLQEKAIQSLKESFAPDLRINRLPQEAQNTAMDQSVEKLKKDYTNLEDKVMGVRHIAPEQTGGLNIGMLEVTLGKNGAEGFATRAEAEQFAVNAGLLKTTYTVDNLGKNYVVKTFKYVPEHTNRILDDSMPLSNKPLMTNWNTFKSLVGSVFSPKQSMSEFQKLQRASVVHGETAMKSIVSTLYEPVKALKPNELKDLDKIMKINRLSEGIPGYSNTRGMYYSNIGELDKAYMKVHGRVPSDQEVAAYFAMVRASDIDWVYRSFNELKRKAVQGFESMRFSRLAKGGDLTQDFNFEARALEQEKALKVMDERIPLTVAYKDSKGIVNKVNLRDLNPQTRENMKSLMKDKGWTLHQPYNSQESQLKAWGVTDDPIHYIFSSGPDARGPLEVTKQVNYRKGFHNDYKAPWFVKSADIKNGRYDGDITFLASSNEAKAHEDMAIWEKARQLMNAKDDAGLKAHLEATTDVSPDEFKAIFNERDATQPFVVVKRGTRSYDSGATFSNGKTFAQNYPDVDTTVDRFHNPGAFWGGDPFVGQRDPLVWELSKRGTEDNPIRELKAGEQFNPLYTQVRSMGDLVRHALYDDYQLTAARNFVETFAGKILYDGQEVSLDKLRSNPIFYLSRGQIVKNDMKTATQAYSMRSAIKNLLGQPSPTALFVDTVKQKMMNFLYTRGGEDALDRVPEKMIPMISDPAAYMRAVASHSKLGVFNVVQYFVQASSVLNTMMISPIQGTRAFVYSGLMGKLLLTEDKNIIDHAGGIAQKLGFNKKEFLEAYNMMKTFKFDEVGGEHSWKVNFADPSLYRDSAGRQFLDKGMFFFNKGEGLVRRTGFVTSYLEYAAKNPGKVGNMTRQDAQQILNKAQMYTANMTRDSNSFWQNGLAGNFTQFWSYNVRMGELMIGQQLTTAEKTRLILGNMMLYGFAPTAGIAAAVEYGDPSYAYDGTGFPGSEDLAVAMAKNGQDIDKSLAGALYNGILSTGLHALTGMHIDVGSRYGMSPIKVFDQIKKNYAENNPYVATFISLLGPSGSIGNDILKQMGPISKDVVDMLSGDMSASAGPLLEQDLIDATRSIAGVNNDYKIYMALRNEYTRSQKGNVVGAADGNSRIFDIIKAITGVQTTQETLAYNLKDNDLQLAKDHKAVADQATRYMGYYFDNMDKNPNDPETARQFLVRAVKLMDVAGFTEEQQRHIIFPPSGRMHQKLTDEILNGLKDLSLEERRNVEQVVNGQGQ